MAEDPPDWGGSGDKGDEGRETGAATTGKAAALAGCAAMARGPGRATTTARRQAGSGPAAMTTAASRSAGRGPQTAGPGQNRAGHYDQNQAAGERGSFHNKYFIQGGLEKSRLMKPSTPIFPELPKG